VPKRLKNRGFKVKKGFSVAQKAKKGTQILSPREEKIKLVVRKNPKGVKKTKQGLKTVGVC